VSVIGQFVHGRLRGIAGLLESEIKRRVSVLRPSGVRESLLLEELRGIVRGHRAWMITRRDDPSGFTSPNNLRAARLVSSSSILRRLQESNFLNEEGVLGENF